MKRLPNIHPGEILFEEFLSPLKISSRRLSKEIGVSQTSISEILNGNRGITSTTALRLSSFFGNSPKFWLGLQNDFDIEECKKTKASELQKIKSYRSKFNSQFNK